MLKNTFLNMNYKYLTLAICLIFLIPLTSNFLFTKNYYQNIRGRVTDNVTQRGIPGASVVIINPEIQKGAYTDKDGYFLIECIPIGRVNLKISAITHNPRFYSNVLLKSGKETILEISLDEKIISTEKVIVKASKKGESIDIMTSEISVHEFSLEETERYAGGFYDPGRMAQNYAGVNIGDDEGNEIVIRGNSPRGLLWKVEGIEVPDPNHFRNGEGSTGGAISMLTSNMMATSEFFTGAFPAKYGNALSGVFDIKLRNGNYKNFENTVSLGFLGLETSFEGPFSNDYNGSYLINYRYSTVSLLQKMGIKIAGEIAPQFQDLSFKLNLPTENSGIFSVFGIGGQSYAGDIFETHPDFPNYNFNKKVEGEETHYVGILGFKHLVNIGENNILETTIAVTHDESNFIDYDAYKIQDNPNPIYKTGLDGVYQHSYLRFQTNFTSKLSNKFTLSEGINFSKEFYNTKHVVYQPDSDSYKDELKQSGNTNYLQSFMQFNYKLNQDLKINGGFNSLFFPLADEITFEPRLSFDYSTNDRQIISIGSGLHSRVAPASIYIYKDSNGNNINSNLKSPKAVHTVISYSNYFNNDWKLKFSTYYQYLYDIPELSNDPYETYINAGAGIITDSLDNNGLGENYGIELTIEKYFNDSWFMMFTTSIFESKSKHLINENNQEKYITRNSKYSNNYLVNFLIGKEFEINDIDIFELKLRLAYAGGLRFIPYYTKSDGDSDKAGYPDFSRAYENRFRDYFRTDFGASYKLNYNGYSWHFAIDIQNVTNESNVRNSYYYAPHDKVYEEFQTGLLPVFIIKLEF